MAQVIFVLGFPQQPYCSIDCLLRHHERKGTTGSTVQMAEVSQELEDAPPAFYIFSRYNEALIAANCHRSQVLVTECRTQEAKSNNIHQAKGQNFDVIYYEAIRAASKQQAG